jgi:2-polyprenyl-6-methoxyphenol hydroxylase-like FAD-dependent oxidoreductase
MKNTGLDKMLLSHGVRSAGTPPDTVGGFYAWANIRNLLLPSDLDLRLSSNFVDLEDKEDGFIESRFSCEENGIENISSIRSRVFVGADGVHSAVSKFMNGRQAQPSGSFLWRCTVDSPPDAIEGQL